MNTQLPRIDRQESMFRQGRSFQPATGGGMGQVNLRMPVQGGLFSQKPLLGQAPVVTTPKVPQLPPQVPTYTPPARQPDPGVRRRPAMRIAWGRLKKMDAQQLAETLAAILERMEAKGIPPGMVAQIQARLARFSETAPEAGTVEITEPEVAQIESELILLEDAEAQDVAGSATPWLIGMGAAIGLGLLASWFSD